MQLKWRSPNAGIYAEQRYQFGLQSWRRRMRPLLVAIFGPFIVGGVIILVVEGHGLSWLGGAAAGVCLAVWAWVEQSPPRYVEKWHDGAEGERKTEQALRPLAKAGWSVIHDIQCHYGNYDHIAVGPSGVYLLESKNLEGIVELRAGVPHLMRRHDPRAVEPFRRIRPQALRAAARIKEDVQQRSGECVWVQAVVVFWSEFPQELVDDGRCVYISGTRLGEWLGERPQRLDRQQVDQIAAAVKRIPDDQPLEI
jgi:hypothetical protein